MKNWKIMLGMFNTSKTLEKKWRENNVIGKIEEYNVFNLLNLQVQKKNYKWGS